MTIRSWPALAARWLVAGVSGGALVAAIEWALLVAEAPDLFVSPAQMALLLPLAIGNAVPYAMLAAAALAVVGGAERLVARRSRWSRLVVAGAVAAATAPYAAWIADEAFSGPQARTLPLRDVWVVIAAVGLAVAFAAAAWMASRRSAAARGAAATALALACATAAVAWLGRTAYRNEYVALHVLLAVWAFLLATIAGRELAARLAPRLATARRVAALGGVTLAVVLGSGVALARSHAAASIVWRETGASRYVTRRWTFLVPAPKLVDGAPATTIEPSLETPASVAARAARARGMAPDIVIFSIDGLRVDHVGAYGYERPTTPNFDRLAARGVRFTNAIVGYPATQVFNTSLLLGRAVPRLKDQQPPGFRPEAMPRLLERRGYHSFVKSWFEHSSRRTFEPAAHGIDSYVQKSRDKDDLEAPMEETLALLDAHLAEADRRRQPVLVWIHLLGTHPISGGRFVPDPDFPFGDTRMDHYDSAIAASDAWIPHLERRLAARADGGRPTIWILGSDHGTNTDRASRDLGDGVVRVPLAIVAPGVAPGVEDALVDASIDLAATVVDLVGIEPPASYDGVSLVPLLLGEDDGPLRSRLVPLSYGDLSGAVYGPWKTVRDDASLLLFDRAADPLERRNLADDRRTIADAMTTAAEAELARRRDEASRAM